MLPRSGWILVSALLLAGCAATPYQPNGLRGGYSEIRTGPDSYAVTFNGNGYSTPVQARSMAMLRGAESSRRRVRVDGRRQGRLEGQSRRPHETGRDSDQHLRQQEQPRPLCRLDRLRDDDARANDGDGATGGADRDSMREGQPEGRPEDSERDGIHPHGRAAVRGRYQSVGRRAFAIAPDLRVLRSLDVRRLDEC